MKISLNITVLILRRCFDRMHGFEQIIFALDARALLLRNYDKLSRIFSYILLIRNHMIFLVQFGINKHLLIFQRPQIALALRARVILLVFEKIYSCLFIPNCTRNDVITYTKMFHELRALVPMT